MAPIRFGRLRGGGRDWTRVRGAHHVYGVGKVHRKLLRDVPLPGRVKAADGVLTDLYGDTAAYDAIAAALPVLKSSNPREIKRYLNLFRFYAFTAFRRKLGGATARTTHKSPRSSRWRSDIHTC
jgi:hypothetical protein